MSKVAVNPLTGRMSGGVSARIRHEPVWCGASSVRCSTSVPTTAWPSSSYLSICTPSASTQSLRSSPSKVSDAIVHVALPSVAASRPVGETHVSAPPSPSRLAGTRALPKRHCQSASANAPARRTDVPPSLGPRLGEKDASGGAKWYVKVAPDTV